MSKQLIAVDIDDVLSASVAGMVAYSNERWGMCLTMEDYTEELAVFWNIPLEEAIMVRIPEMLQSGLFGRHAYIKGAPEVLCSLKETYDLVAVTSRRKILQPETDVWLLRHFPGLFREVHYMGIWDGPHEVSDALKKDKTAICLELGASYLIDDQEKHCFGAAAAGVDALLFGDYRWNRQTSQLPPNVTRVKDWESIRRYFDAKG